MDGQDAHPTRNLLFVERTGRMPIPQEIHSLWNRHLAFYGRAGCPSHKKFTLCGTGILPVADAESQKREKPVFSATVLSAFIRVYLPTSAVKSFHINPKADRL
ncbi:MAG: hypothetical protein EAZ09_06890 [Oscillatoriales cyanobacterium]|nr:MAG: hypothetical protein EAZ09_06890 [Oscillatoriales cyanobacterium]